MIENFIELKKIEGINLLMVRGRNFGIKFTRKIYDKKKYTTYDQSSGKCKSI